MMGPPSGHRTPAGWILWQLIWFLPLVVAAFSLGVWLVAKGSEGDHIATAWSLPISIVAVSLTAFLFLIDRKNYTSALPVKSLRRRLRLAVLLTAVVGGVGGGLLFWTVIHKTDIPVTDRVSVSIGGIVPTGRREMRDGGQATIQIPGAPPERRHLALILSLTNLTNVGDCVKPAKLGMTSVIDGQQRESASLRSGDEARLDLTGVTHQASVIVTLHVQDQSCVVDLGVSRAILYN